MTEPSFTSPPRRLPSDESRDHWELAFERLGRRRLFRLALVVLALLYGAAIYAPLIANDRPYVLEAIDHGAYDRARRGIYSVALELKGLVEGGEEGYLEGRTAGSRQSYAEALSAERQAMAGRLATMRRYLPREHRPALDALDEETARVSELAIEGRGAEAGAAANELRPRARELRDALKARRAGDDAGVSLRAATSYPLPESLSAPEVFFLVLWAFLLSWPLWNPVVNRILLGGSRARIRGWRRRKAALVIGLSLACAVAWKLTVDGETTFHTAPFKEGLTSGEIEPVRAVFPPLAIGFAETHLAEEFRPPTWTAAAQITEEGYYESGARAPAPDPVTGFVPGPQPVRVRFGEPARNAATRHVFGTDSLGRDLFVRVLYGARVSLSVGLVSTVILVVIGTFFGCLAGYFGGRVDLLISRLIEVVICFPVFFLILVVVAFVGPSILNIMVVIGLLRWTGVARLARAEFLRLKELDFVVAARALGLPTRRTIFRHMLPNALGPLLVAASFSVAAGILIESELSFLGFGIQAPVPSWGSLVTESGNAANWWIQVFPGALIFVTVLCYNLVGDAVRDALDPRTGS